MDKIIEGQDKSLCLTTTDGLIRRRPDGSETFYVSEAPRSDYLTDILEDSEGRIWLAYQSVIYVLKPETSGVSASTPSVQVRRLSQIVRDRISVSEKIGLPATPGEVVRYSAAIGTVANTNASVRARRRIRSEASISE